MNAYASPWEMVPAAPTPTQAAIQKRCRAKAALWKRFQREANGLDLIERMRLRNRYQEHLDNIESEYRRDMRLALGKVMMK